MIDEARSYALDAHGAQRYGDLPYAVHLDAVAALLEPYGDVAQVVGYLHDVVEDTERTVADVEETFGDLVARSVAILTDEPGADRRERKARTYAKMRRVEGELELALLVKTADRLANVGACVEYERPDKMAMYADEHDAFRAAVYRDGLCDDLWRRLDALLVRSST